MRNKIKLSNRQQNFVDRNIIEPNNGCYAHIVNILENSDIDNYEIKKYNSIYALFLYFENITYIMHLGDYIYNKYPELEVWQKNEINGRLRIISRYNDDSCWIESIDDIMLFEKDKTIR